MGSVLPGNFTSLPAAQKLAAHVERMNETWYSTDGQLPSISPGSSVTKLVQNRPLASIFLHNSDERDVALQGAIKPIHCEGVSAPVAFEVAVNPYTGIFQTGGMGIIRLSRGVTGTPFLPGLALKIFVDGRPSVNFHAIYSLDGQADGDFFKNVCTTHFAPPNAFRVKVLSFFFRRSLSSVSSLSCGRPADETTIPQFEAASMRADGTEEGDPKAPEELHFVPKVSAPLPDASQFREAIMRRVRQGDIIYEIQDRQGLLIGSVRATGPFCASSHGDQMLFKHQRFSTAPRTCPMG